MKRTESAIIAVVVALAGMMTVSCEKGKSYAELLDSENRAVNRFLVEHRVERHIPADTIFTEVGEDSPFYQLDSDGNIFMQVIDCGSGPKAETDQIVYFRFMRYNLKNYSVKNGLGKGEGNAENLTGDNYSFRFENFNLPSSTDWGSGIQMPLYYLPLNCEVNLIIKSQYGVQGEISNVQPYLYNIRYFKSMI